jgi:DNA-binding transcriptional regulator YiaG
MTSEEKLKSAVRELLDNFPADWCREHMQDDHICTLDHKSEVVIAECIQDVREAIEGTVDRLSLGARIRAGRLKAKLTQRELAKLLEVSQVTVSRWEKGHHCPLPAFLFSLKRLLGPDFLDLED